MGLKSLVCLVYSHFVRPPNCKKQIEGPALNDLPPDMKLEKWMVDMKWAPEDGPVVFTLLKDSVSSDHIRAIMNEALHTWNKGAWILVIGHGNWTDGPRD